MQQVNNHPFRIINEAEIKEVTGGAVPVENPPTTIFAENGGPIYSTMALGEEGGEPIDIFS